jgi:protein-S-isoprenylcysteine O-methyltransferase Ste14
LFEDFPLFLLACTIVLYWGTVVLFSLAKRLRPGHGAGLIPSHAFERRLWLLIVPVVVAWIILPILAGKSHTAWLRAPSWASSMPVVYSIRCMAALFAVGCYLLSLCCWVVLGRRWSMAIVPGATTELVRRGPYRWVRHPIYSLSVALMLASVVVMLTIPMAVAAGLHVIAMHLKARHEEQHLSATFGPIFREYCREVGRFWPHWRTSESAQLNAPAT